MSDAETERRVGTTLLGKWTLTRLLGTGGMAAVYVGAHKIGRSDAIKILHPEIAASAEFRARFEQEAHAVNRFRHPGAVEIRDIDVTEDGAPFLVMELLEGETLAERASRDAVTHDEALRFADELLDVLAAAHAEGIIHRDIKPDNLFIQTNGSLKVLDFGIARVRDVNRGQNRTRTGQTLGTVSYMPPEQAKGLPIDHRADLYATGATLFRVLTKRRVHEGQGELELLMQVANEPAPPLASLLPSARPGLCDVVDRALAHDRGRRYPDALTMQADVRALRRGELPPYATSRLAAGDSPRELAPLADVESSSAVLANEQPPTVREAPARRTSSQPPPRVAPPPPAAISERDDPPLSLLGNSAVSIRQPETPASATSTRLVVALGVGGVLLLALLTWLFTRGAPATTLEAPDLAAPEATKTRAPPSKATATSTSTPPPATAPPPTAAPPGGPPAKKK